MRAVGNLVASLAIASSILGASANPLVLRDGKKNPFKCTDPDADPFCTPKDNADLYVGQTINVVWNPDKFGANSTIQVVLQYRNDSQQSKKHSPEINNQKGFWSVKLQDDWLNGFDAYNYTLMAQETLPSKATKWYNDEGTKVTLTNAPASHYPPPPPTSLDDDDGLGLKIGLPLGLGFFLLVVVGLWIGMRKHRQIGLGNVMGRKRGYDTGKSRRQRMGQKKNGGIRLEDREGAPDEPIYNYADNQQPSGPYLDRPVDHQRNESLGSLVSEDPPRGDNVFRQEIERQRTGGRF